MQNGIVLSYIYASRFGRLTQSIELAPNPTRSSSFTKQVSTYQIPFIYSTQSFIALVCQSSRDLQDKQKYVKNCKTQEKN